MPADVEPEKGCGRGAVTFTTRPAPDLTGAEWTMYKTIRDVVFAADGSILQEHGTRGQVDIIEHVGACSVCLAEWIASNYSSRITMI